MDSQSIQTFFDDLMPGEVLDVRFMSGNCTTIFRGGSNPSFLSWQMDVAFPDEPSMGGSDSSFLKLSVEDQRLEDLKRTVRLMQELTRRLSNTAIRVTNGFLLNNHTKTPSEVIVSAVRTQNWTLDGLEDALERDWVLMFTVQAA